MTVTEAQAYELAIYIENQPEHAQLKNDTVNRLRL